LEFFENYFMAECSLYADPNIMDLLQREHPEILAGIRAGYGKMAFGVQKL